MAASSMQQLAHLSLSAGGFSLPTLLFFALLVGFAFSSSSLQALYFPATLESFFLVSLPHLWQAFLSWITPPCLFVLLNGIIVILTATSGRLSSSKDGGPSELEPNLATQIENVPFNQSAATVERPFVSPRSPSVMLLDAAVQIADPLDMHIPSLHTLQDAEEGELMEPLSRDPFLDGCGDELQLVLCMNPQDVSESTPISPAAEMDPEHEAMADDDLSISSSSSSSSFSSSSSSAPEDIVKAGSEPSSPLFSSSPAPKNNMRRSMSIDSVSLSTEGASEQLSEEAFKKRIDDFILKTTSKIRSGTKSIG